MASLKEIRGRIGSIRNISQITRAMELVAASRMRRAQDSILAARPYADALQSTLSRVAAAIDEEADPLLARRPVRRIGIIVMTTDRGLAGALDANTVRAVLRFIADRASTTRRSRGNGTGDRDGGEDIGPAEIEAITVGRKGLGQLRRAGVPIAAAFPRLGDKPTFGDVTPIARLVTEDFLTEKYDEILPGIAEKKALDDALTDSLKQAVEAFRGQEGYGKDEDARADEAKAEEAAKAAQADADDAEELAS